MLTYNKTKQIFTNSSEDEIKTFTDTFNNYKDLFGFETDFQMNAFLAQIREEVGTSLTPKRENLNYSCDALKSIFGYYKKHPDEAHKDGRCNNHPANQQNIANKAYANRIGNGDVSSGDGWRYRGAGYIQLTGKANFEEISNALSLALQEPITPEELSKRMNTVEYALLSAMAFYLTHKLYTATNIDEMTAMVNKHTNSYDKRKQHYLHIASIDSL